MMNILLLHKDGSKKQRGSNYTPREQTILLELVKKNKEIIENKETNAVMCSKKREAWDAIARRYNAVAVTGPRDWMQLRNLYENLKQRRKRKILRESMSNSPDSTKTKPEKRKNADILSFPPSPSQQLHVKDTDQLNEDASSYMKEKSCADEAYSSALADIDKQVITLASPKSDPLQFGIELTVSGEDMETITVPAKPLFIVKQEIEEDSISVASSDKEFPDEFGIPGFPKRKQPDNETCCSSLKEEYYKQKLKNAKLERKFLLERHKMEKEKHTLELEILKLQRQKLLE